MRTITNSSGTFWVDAEGILLKYQCAEDNYYQPLGEPSYRDEKHLDWLHIPEGVTALPAGAFDGYKFFMEVTLPETLARLGDSTGGVFRQCVFSHDLKLPQGITFVGEDSFFLSALGTIRIYDDMNTQMVHRLVQLFRNHTYHSFLFYPVEKIRDLPALQVPTTRLYSESGTFYVDKLGVLQDFCCSPENNAGTCAPGETRKLYTLHIPEGVTVLKEDAFRDYTVLYKMTLPDSLLLMGTGHGCVLSDCRLPDVVIPGKLKILGTFAFGHSDMRSLRIPKGLKSEYARQFKSSTIGTLYLPEDFRTEDTLRGFHEKYEWGKEQYGYIRSMLVNDTEIGKVVFE